MASSEKEFTSEPGRLALWLTPLIGPIAWLVDLQVSFSGDRYSCESNSALTLHLTTLVTLLAAVAGVWLTWRQWSRTGRQWPGEEPGVTSRSRFLSFVGFWINLMFVASILAQAVPKWMLHPCQ